MRGGLHLVEYFQITFPGHSNFQEICTDHVSNANGRPDSNIRAIHGFLEVEVRIFDTVINTVFNMMSFNIKHFNSSIFNSINV